VDALGHSARSDIQIEITDPSAKEGFRKRHHRSFSQDESPLFQHRNTATSLTKPSRKGRSSIGYPRNDLFHFETFTGTCWIHQFAAAGIEAQPLRITSDTVEETASSHDYCNADHRHFDGSHISKAPTAVRAGATTLASCPQTDTSLAPKQSDEQVICPEKVKADIVDTRTQCLSSPSRCSVNGSFV